MRALSLTLTRRFLPALLLALGSALGTSTAAAASVAIEAFGDDLQAEQIAMLNDEFSAAYPAGSRLTAALTRTLQKRGLAPAPGTDAERTLSGTVTAAYMMSRGMPTNSIAARYRLTDAASGQVIAEGTAEASDWNNQDAAQKLAEAILKAALK